jgi:hypothetical protein
LVAVAAVSVLCYEAHFVRQLLEVPKDAYATWDGANLVIAHLRYNDGRWPTGWADLEKTFHNRQVRTHGSTMEDIGRRLVIQFDVESSEFASRSAEAIPNVIRLRSGKETYWEGAEPNSRVHQYLNDPNMDP